MIEILNKILYNMRARIQLVFRNLQVAWYDETFKKGFKENKDSYEAKGNNASYAGKGM